MPISVTESKQNINSVSFNEYLNGCFQFDFFGISSVTNYPIVKWEWSFGDGGTAFTQNTSHTYSNSDKYTVTLTVTDTNGCKASYSKVIN